MSSALTDFSCDRAHSPFEWTHPSWLIQDPRPLPFKPHWLKLAGTKILVPDLCSSQFIPQEQWNGFPKEMSTQNSGVEIH